MSPTNKTKEEHESDELLQSIARSLDVLVKLKVLEVKGDRQSKEMILLLHKLGCAPKEIAAALGKTPNDVNPVISRARKAKGTAKRKGRSRRRG